MQKRIDGQNEIIRQLRSQLEDIEKSQNQDQKLVKELTRKLEAAKKMACELAKQLKTLCRKHTSNKKTELLEKEAPAQITKVQTSPAQTPVATQSEKKTQNNLPVGNAEECIFLQ